MYQCSAAEGARRKLATAAALQECKHLIALGMPHMVKSEVVDNDTGKSVDSRSADFAPARVYCPGCRPAPIRGWECSAVPGLD